MVAFNDAPVRGRLRPSHAGAQAVLSVEVPIRVVLRCRPLLRAEIHRAALQASADTQASRFLSIVSD